MFARFRHDKAAAPQGPPHNGHHGAGAKAGLNAPSDSLTQPPLRFAGRRDYDIEPGADEWGLTPNQQEAAVESFRRQLVDIDPRLWDPQRHDFFTLRRFLRARSYHTARAVDMWRAHLEWRQANDVDRVLQDFSFPERGEFLRHAPQGYYHTDRQGRPVYVQLLGSADLGALRRIATEERMFRFMVHEHEYVCKVILPLCSRLAGRHVDTIFNIVDVKGLRLSQLTSDTLRFFQRVTKTDQDHYPEMLAHVAVVNAPPVFRLVWGMVRRFLEPRTQSKIQILGPNYLSALEQWIEPDNLLPLFVREGAAAAAAAAEHQHHHWRRHSSGGVVGEEAAAAARLEEAARQLEGNEGPWRDLMLYERLGLDLQQLKAGLPPPPPPPPAAAAATPQPQTHPETLPQPELAAPVPLPAAEPVATAAAVDGLRTSAPLRLPVPALTGAGAADGLPLRPLRQQEEAGGEGPASASESEPAGQEGCLDGGQGPVRSWADLEELRSGVGGLGGSGLGGGGSYRSSRHRRHSRHHGHHGHGHGGHQHGQKHHRHPQQQQQQQQQQTHGQQRIWQAGGEVEEGGDVDEGGTVSEGADQEAGGWAGMRRTQQHATPAASQAAEEAPKGLLHLTALRASPGDGPAVSADITPMPAAAAGELISAHGACGASAAADTAPCSPAGTLPLRAPTTTTAATTATASPAPTAALSSSSAASLPAATPAAAAPAAAVPAVQTGAAGRAHMTEPHDALGGRSASQTGGAGGSSMSGGSNDGSTASSYSSGGSSSRALMHRVVRVQQLMAAAVAAAAPGHAAAPIAASLPPPPPLLTLPHSYQMPLLQPHGVGRRHTAPPEEPQPAAAAASGPDAAAAGAAGAAGRGLVAEGSLLHRVQVLEVGLDACLAASCLALQQLAELRQQQRQRHQQQVEQQAHALAPACPLPPATATAAAAGYVGSGRVWCREGAPGAGSSGNTAGPPAPLPAAALAAAAVAGSQDCSLGGTGRQQGSIRTLMPPPDSPPPPGRCGDPTCPGCGSGCAVM